MKQFVRLPSSGQSELYLVSNKQTCYYHQGFSSVISNLSVFYKHWSGITLYLTPSLPEYLMEFCKATLTFESVDKILWCDHSNESSLPLLSHGTIYLGCSSNFWVCGPNPPMWPFKWKLSACTFTVQFVLLVCLFVKILENEMWKFGRNLPLTTFRSGRVKVWLNYRIYSDRKQAYQRSYP